MPAKSTTFSTDFLKLIYNATPIANLADNAGSSPLTTLYVSLHTASPGVGGNQTTNEAAYTGYSRVAVARTTGGWTVTGASVSPVANITFPIDTAVSGTEVEIYGAVGTASSGTGKILHWGPLTTSITANLGVTPVILAGTTMITES